MIFHFSKFSVSEDTGTAPPATEPTYFDTIGSASIKQSTAVAIGPDGHVYACNVKGLAFPPYWLMIRSSFQSHI